MLDCYKEGPVDLWVEVFQVEDFQEEEPQEEEPQEEKPQEERPQEEELQGPGGDAKLGGNPPPEFNSDCSYASTFMNLFNLY